MVTIQPAGLATTALVADQLSVLATFTERLCRPYNASGTLQPQYAITYTAGTPTLNGTTAFVPVTAVVTIVTPAACGGSCGVKTQLYTEQFVVAFQGQTAVPTSVTIESEGRTAAPASIGGCGKAKEYTIHDSLAIAIA